MGCLVAVVALAAAVAVGLHLWLAWLNRPPPLPSIPDEYLSTVQAAARTCPQVNVPLLAAQIDAESHWNPEANSGQAQGIAQFYPSTWSEWGKDYSGDGTADVWNPQDAIRSQAAYMCALFKQVKTVPGDPTQLTLAAYNAGPTAVINAGGIPRISETENYVTRIEDLIPDYTKTYAQQVAAQQSASASPSPS
ncbi:lytic transglycosylase domain-containing protein [Streptomyces sp. SL54]|uniref:Lytic transglycosylase domain-containing protein n=1 Tax=Streptantibioticus silvisoli TaxID=2705255 RepID=A0ABT6W0C8_9ACTN|nr:lytic transglycosylase domain-containing protein [Streptantibioticus silvisoli]